MFVECDVDNCNTKTKTDQGVSVWKTEGLVLTDTGSVESKGFDSYIF